ncbi:MAG: hypothetical protein NTV51_05775, partial [Verrucomicrobia bacterium]|nr:hypothetical protein [Verrucomicrobiota bacterium]
MRVSTRRSSSGTSSPRAGRSDVRLPRAPGVTSGTAHVVLSGGGIAAGKEGAFTFNVAVALAGPDVPVTSLVVSGRLTAAMDTPRTFRRLATQAEAAATGPLFPQGVKLSADIAASREGTGETYALSLWDATRLLAIFKADLPAAAHRLSGTWKLDLRDTDVAPFTLGRPLPSFGLVGEGSLALDTATNEVRTIGKLNVSADRLGVLRPELAVIGPARVEAEFDLARRGDSLRVERLTAAFSGAHPVASVRSLQSFEFAARTGELKVADPEHDLLNLTLQGLPLGWAQPFIRDFTLTGGNIRGEFVAVARNGGFAVRPKAPLAADAVSVAQGGKALLRAVDVAVNASADYTPQGWQAEVAPLMLKSGSATLLSLAAKAGQLAGPDQPVKATGKFSSSLPGVLAQPVASGTLVLTGGEAEGEFVASLGKKREIQGRLALTQLAVDPTLAKGPLPALSAGVRAELSAAGVITLNVPLVIAAGDRQSDLTVDGTVTPGKSGVAVNARVSSTLLAIEDAQVFAVVLPAAAPAPA